MGQRSVMGSSRTFRGLGNGKWKMKEKEEEKTEE